MGLPGPKLALSPSCHPVPQSPCVVRHLPPLPPRPRSSLPTLLLRWHQFPDPPPFNYFLKQVQIYQGRRSVREAKQYKR